MDDSARHLPPHRLRVRYAETDQMGVAHHAAYLPWLEEARIVALGQLGFAYRHCEEQGLFMPVHALEISYRRPLRFDDEVEIRTWIAALGRTRLCFTSTLHRDDDLIAEAVVRVAATDTGGRICRLPEALLTAIAC